MPDTDARIHTANDAPMTQAQYRNLIARFDDMIRKLERVMQLVDELGASLGHPTDAPRH